MLSRVPLSLLASVLLANVFAVGLARAGDQEEARQAVQSGEIRPLDQVLAAARTAVPGDVVKLDLKREHGRWVYELKILTASGKRREVEVDAKSLAIVDDDDDD